MKLTAPAPTPDTSTTISLTGGPTATRITVNWTVTSGEATAFKVCKSLEPNPTYPEDECELVTGANSYTWEINNGQTYYIRVGKYISGPPTIYSNQIMLKAPNLP